MRCQIVFADIHDNTVPDLPQDLVTLRRSANGIYHLEGMNVHGYDVSFFCFFFQFLLEADVIVASGHRVNIGVTLQFPRLLFADIREAEDRFVQ